MLRSILLLALLWLGAPAWGQDRPAPVRIVLATDAGDILIELDVARAPVTAGNFLLYVDQRRYDGSEFYRAMQLGPGTGLVQGGIRDARRLLPPVAHEPTAQTGLAHVEGAISMARREPGSAQADFFILIGPIPGFDAGPAAGGDQLGFAVFGRVVGGMDVVRRIHGAPTSPTEGEGAMRGQMLSPRIRIVTARRAR